MTTAIVAGGGVAGLLAARLLLRRYPRVLLVERDAACGGLLGSISDDAGVAFDHGAHVLSETGLAELDELLYSRLDPAVWRSFRVLKAGNYFAGAMNRDSPFPDARRLGPQAFRQGLAELAAVTADPAAPPPAHLGEALSRRFGATFANEVLAPAVRKQLGIDPALLHPETPFVPRRIVCGDADESRGLKGRPQFAEPVAFASYEEGVGALHHMYPRTGGIGQWVDSWVSDLRNDGVEVACGRTIATITHNGGCVSAVTLDDGREVACAGLAWTLPSAMLLRAAGIPFTGQPPPLRPIGLFHLVFDRPFEDPNFHVTCYDESLRIFRVTLYPNLRGAGGQPPFNCSVEVIGTPGTDFPGLLPGVLDELRRIGITADDACLRSSLVRVVPMGFPATTPEFMAGNADQTSLAARELGNVHLLGRARCPPFFTTDVVTEVYRALSGDGNG